MSAFSLSAAALSKLAVLTLLATAATAPSAAAAAVPAAFKSSAQPTSSTKGQVTLPSLFIPTTKATWMYPNASLSSPAELRAERLREVSLQHLNATLSVGDGVDMLYKSAYQDAAGVFHFYVSETVNGLEIANAVANVATDKYGQVMARTSSWVKVAKPEVQRLSRRGLEISAEEAILSFARAMDETLDVTSLSTSPDPDAPDGSDKVVVEGIPFATGKVTAVSKLYKTESDLRHVWDLSVPLTTAWLNVFIDKATGEVVGASDWSSSFQLAVDPRGNSRSANSILIKRQAAPIPPSAYRVVPLGGISPDQTQRRVVINPSDPEASPLGWHDANDGRGSVPTTVGNNAIAQENRANRANFLAGLRPGVSNFNFDFPIDDKTLRPPQYADASIANVFFLTNAFHDIMYKYGFDEVSGNFQVENFGRGGLGGDPVIANVQDGSGTNNANFATPPDGQAGVMRMFVFTGTNPDRDGAIDNSVVLHELVHGLSNRLTGGPANSNCLQSLESGGMGEGWSDFIGTALEMTSRVTRNNDRMIGAYVSGNRVSGVRRFPMSTSTSRNPLLYSTITRDQRVHAVGEIWAVMLFEAYWNVVEKLGFEPNLRDGARSGKGNTLFLQTVVEGMKLQPCNPSFVQARDAILMADQALNGGANLCEIFKGFAKRGLGARAVSGEYTDSFDLPPQCA